MKSEMGADCSARREGVGLGRAQGAGLGGCLSNAHCALALTDIGTCTSPQSDPGPARVAHCRRASLSVTCPFPRRSLHSRPPAQRRTLRPRRPRPRSAPLACAIIPDVRA